MDQIRWFECCLVIAQLLSFSFGALFGVSLEKRIKQLDKEDK